MPVSIEGRGRPCARRRAALLELHEDEVPDLDEAVAVFVLEPGGPPGIWSP
jgi:hypothetical protein